MASLKKCVIGVELASSIRRLVSEFGLKMPKGRLAFLCPECGRPVRPHVSSERKLASHFEHLRRNPSCRFAAD